MDHTSSLWHLQGKPATPQDSAGSFTPVHVVYMCFECNLEIIDGGHTDSANNEQYLFKSSIFFFLKSEFFFSKSEIFRKYIVFGDELWSEISTSSFDYPENLFSEIKDKSKLEHIPKTRSYPWPNTNGRSRSKIYDNLYFAGFDQGYLGGLTIGIYSWENFVIFVNFLNFVNFVNFVNFLNFVNFVNFVKVSLAMYTQMYEVNGLYMIPYFPMKECEEATFYIFISVEFLFFLIPNFF